MIAARPPAKPAKDARNPEFFALYIGMAGVRIENGANPVYIYKDHLGSPTNGAGADGIVDWREDHAPFGERLLAPAANAGNTGFTGHVEDAATGLVYMQARYYDPVIGRFLSTDPVGYEDQLNLYAYVANDPVNATDPNGEQSCTVICAVLGGPVPVNSPSGRPGGTYNHAAVSAGVQAAGMFVGAVETTAVATATVSVAGPAEAVLSAAGAGPTLASAGGTAIQGALVATELQAGHDLATTGQVDGGNLAKAASIGSVGGGLTGMIPKVGGIGAALARTELGATVGATGAVVMNGSQTTGQDVLNGAGVGAVGGNSDAAGAAVAISQEFRDDDRH